MLAKRQAWIWRQLFMLGAIRHCFLLMQAWNWKFITCNQELHSCLRLILHCTSESSTAFRWSCRVFCKNNSASLAILFGTLWFTLVAEFSGFRLLCPGLVIQPRPVTAIRAEMPCVLAAFTSIDDGHVIAPPSQISCKRERTSREGKRLAQDGPSVLKELSKTYQNLQWG